MSKNEIEPNEKKLEEHETLNENINVNEDSDNKPKKGKISAPWWLLIFAGVVLVIMIAIIVTVALL